MSYPRGCHPGKARKAPPAREGGRAFVSNSISVARAVAVRAAELFN